MEPINRNIRSLVEMFINQELLLPEMQRKYVWRAEQARNLIDSIYRGYPSGSILIWETENIPEIKMTPVEKKGSHPLGKRLLLLDGQQRITSLASIIEKLPIRIKEGTKVREKNIDVYFNLDHPDEVGPEKATASYDVGDIVEAKWEDGEFYTGTIHSVESNKYFIHYDDGGTGWTDEVQDLSEENKKELFFQIFSKKIANKPNWISITKLFKEGVGVILRELKMGADDPRFDKYNARLNQLYGRKDTYLYPVQIIRDKSYDEVTDIFIRVNTSGTRLRSSDLALAQITSVWPGSMKIFEAFVDTCVENDFYLDENFLVRCLICIATDQPKFDQMSKMSADKIQESWELTKKGVHNTINFLKNNAFVDSMALLPSPIILIPLVYFASNNELSDNPEAEKGFLYWLFNAAIWQRYSGSMETKLAQDLNAFSDKKPWNTLVNNIWQTVGNDRKVEAKDFKGKGITNPLFFMMYVIARANKARDYETGNVINYANIGKNNEIEYDHIYPKSKLDAYYKKKGINDAERKALVNDICNFAFMTKKGNIIKTNEDPKEYFPRVYKKYGGEQIFKCQQIPYDLGLLEYDHYETFLAKRAEILANEINVFLSQYI